MKWMLAAVLALILAAPAVAEPGKRPTKPAAAPVQTVDPDLQRRLRVTMFDRLERLEVLEPALLGLESLVSGDFDTARAQLQAAYVEHRDETEQAVLGAAWRAVDVREEATGYIAALEHEIRSQRAEAEQAIRRIYHMKNGW